VPPYELAHKHLRDARNPDILHLFGRNLMSLSNKTIQNLAIALTPDVIDDIFMDERWVDLMMEVVPDFVAKNLQTEDFDLVAELSSCIMDNIQMLPRKTN
jgi:hypothetical protein